MSEAATPTNLAYSESMTSFDSTPADASAPLEMLITQPGSYEPSELAKLIGLIQDLSSSNINLLQQATELRQSLVECQEATLSDKKQSLMAQSMLSQQNQDLEEAQDQVRCLSQKLIDAHQTAQQQKTVIQTLTTELESSKDCLKSSQERVAQLERECSFIQAKYNEQSHQLVETENNCEELRNRLNRQQQQNLQLKVALEKCLDEPVSNNRSGNEYNYTPDYTTTEQPGDSTQDESFFFNLHPIQPRSTQPQSCEVEVVNEGNFRSELDHKAVPNMRQAWEEQQGAVMHVFFESSLWQLSGESQEHKRTTAEIYFSKEERSKEEEENWQSLVDLLEVVAEPSTTNSRTENRLKKTSSDAPSTQWPSPLLDPSRPPKGRKSLAAIELPTFNRR